EQFKSESDIKIKQATGHISETTEKNTTFKKDREALSVRITELSVPQSDGNQDVEGLSNKMSQAAEQFNTSNIAHIRHQNLLSNFVKDKEFKELKLKELSSQLNNTRERLISAERDRIDIEDQLVVVDKELKDLYSEKQGFQSTLSDAEQNFLRAKNVISELEEQIKNLIRNQNQLQHTIQNLKDQFSEQKFQIQSIGERLRIEFQVSINDYINNPVNSDKDFSQMED
ncbi:MAG TPA: hypothetical protein PK611_08540, partial [Saprospiraceae bacterium]|nr:hypothetical protein [Saprospiraceae bacterium]